MKKKYLLFSCFAAFALAATMKVSAQALSGVYTINNAQPTSGSNFQSFTDFASAINTNGVSGPVTVNVNPLSGPYNEQVTFSSIIGATSVNKITINGNGRLLYYNATSSGAPHTLLLNGADHFTINELNVQGLGSSYAMVCVLSGGANFNAFNGCVFEAPLNGTFSYQVPFAITGSPNSPTSSGGGEYNSVTSCTMMNGYYGITAYGLTSAPYTQGNSFKECRVTNFYYYGMYFPYAKNMTVMNCTFDRITRTSGSTVYGWYNYYCQGGMFDGNRFENFFAAMNGPSTTCRVIYGYGNPVANGPRNTYRNNIITDMYTNGSTYGMYVPYSGSDVYNNTLNFDWAGTTASNLIYGIYGYGNPGFDNDITNNIITIRRGGSGNSRYPMYLATTGNVTIDYNNINVLNGSGSNYHGYQSGGISNLAAWQGLGFDANGYDLDPMYTSTVDLQPTNPSLNNLGADLGLILDQKRAVRHQTTPDIGALEFLTPTCAGTPSMTVVGPNYAICPGESVYFSIGNLSSDLGITYQWQVSSTSQVGPFVPVSGANSIFYTAPSVTATSWYSAIISCTAPGGGSVQAVAQVNVAGTTTSTIPYFEGFEGIGLEDRLPNCSWMAPEIGSSAKTYTSAAGGNLLPNNGSAFASFANLGTSTNYYYTNGIWMEAGITYSASLWYQTGMSGATNWTDLSIHYSTSQSTAALTQIAAAAPAVSPFYKALSNTFTVPVSGIYYVAIRASNNSGGSLDLAWDDLSIIIPCTPSLNTPVLSLTASQAKVCSGKPIMLNATGADTYSWSTGASGPMITEFPQISTVIHVTGTNSLTGCTAMASQNIIVNPTPAVSLFALPPSVCAGKPVNLQASGAMSYTWSLSNVQGASVVHVPTGNTTYSVQGMSQNGCVGESAVQVSVLPLPNVQGIPSNNQICNGDELVLSGTGALSYQWVSVNPAMVLEGTVLTLIPRNTDGSLTFTVTGFNDKGCSNTAVVAIIVDACTGVAGHTVPGFNLYPNPGNDLVTIELSDAGDAKITVIDVAGRIIASESGTGNVRHLNISDYTPGVYFVEVKSADKTVHTRMVKQ